MNNQIKDRPESLNKLPYYLEIPSEHIYIDLESTIHDYLKDDLFQLDGPQPFERKYAKTFNGIFTVNPSDLLLSLYEKENINFQMINIVINAFSFIHKNNVLSCKPYSISLVPFSKRGKISTCPPDLFKHLMIDEIREQEWAYLGFNPFNQGYDIFGQFSAFYVMATLKHILI